jgi:micrococcal nuclease
VPDESLVIGAYVPAAQPVIDGDTLLLEGLPDSVRVRAVDTEEVFHEERLRREAEADFAAYAARMQGDARMPTKYGTPAGEAAKAFVERLFGRVSKVRLERDAAGDSDRDTYGRVLAHVILILPEGELLLAEELVRRGHTPYFVKYGRSLRFDDRLKGAEAEARAERRGIWGAEGPAHYPDYDARVVWWHRRAAQIEWWRTLGPAPDRFTLGLPADVERLAENVGQTVTVFGLVGEMKTEGRPKILFLGNPPGPDLPVVVFDGAVWGALDLEALAYRYVMVTGPLSLYRNRPQIVVQDASQITSP